MQRWSQMTEVERVDVYTRQSMYLMLWVTELAILLSAVNDTSSDRRGELALAAAMAL